MDKAGREFRRTKLKLRKINNYEKELNVTLVSLQSYVFIGFCFLGCTWSKCHELQAKVWALTFIVYVYISLSVVICNTLALQKGTIHFKIYLGLIKEA